MVVLLVIAMFVSVAVFAILRQRRAEWVELAAAIDAPIERVLFHTGHAWAAPVGRGYYKIGLNDLAASLAGTPDRLSIPTRGESLYQDVRQLALSHRERELKVQSPLSGKVKWVNEAALSNPAIVARDPYRKGWLALIRPRHLRELPSLLDNDAARRWLDGLRRKVAEFTHHASPSTAWDGGPLNPGFGDDLTDAQFHELRIELFGESK